ncbi:MAG: SURF1 family protein [Proteobacteria bacterium]|nr:SURF1 family protein [Pseudomonadota bacterium]
MVLTPSRRRGLAILAATVVGVALTARLGVWQLHRAAEKEALEATRESRGRLPALTERDLARDETEVADQAYRRIRLHGRWLADHTIYLDNRQMDGHPGFYVVTPLLLTARGDAVVVQRGWIPRNSVDRTVLAPVQTPTGDVDVEGIVAPPPTRLFEFAHETEGTIRQNLDLAAFAVESGVALRPLSVQQSDGAATAGDGLQRRWPRPAVDVQRNYGYAFQWFAMAALMTGLYVWFQLVRPRLRRGA